MQKKGGKFLLTSVLKNAIFNMIRGDKMKKTAIIILSVLCIFMAVFCIIYAFPSNDVDFRGLITKIEKGEDAWAITVLDSTDTNYSRTFYIDTKTKFFDAHRKEISLSEIKEGIFIDVTCAEGSDFSLADKVKIFSPEN